MNSLPYYKRFPRDFLDGTIGMGLELKGAYAVVLDLIYMRNGRLPDDAQYIAGQLGCSVRKWRALRDELFARGKINIDHGIISNSRADYLLEETRTFRDKQAENRSHPNKIKAVQSPKPDHTDTDTDTDTEVRTEANASVERASAPPPKPLPPESKSTGKARGAARGSRIPSNWTPTPKDYAFASSEGMTREEINREADRFRDYWIATTGRNACKLDWEGTWRNWIRRVSDDKRKRAAARPAYQRGGAEQTLSAFDRVAASMAGHAARPADPVQSDAFTIEGEHWAPETRTGTDG